jgi:C-terminal processing protease CtpA/Prc
MMERNYCRRFVGATKTVPLCVAAIGGMLLIVAVTHAQQAPGIPQTPPQTAQPGQAADLQQSSQLQDLSGQPQDPIDAQQQTQQDPLNGQQNQINQQQSQPGQELAQPDRSMIRSGTGQLGEPGTGAQRGELGVFVIESAGPGVRVSRVVTGSAADAAGLQSGDILMQINGQSVDQPQEVIRLIRAIAAGEAANLRIWRNGQDQELAATLQPMRVRESYQSNFRGEPTGMNGDLAQRTQRLEQQLNVVMQELQRLRQEVIQMRGGAGGVGGTTGADGQPQNGTQPGAEPFDQNATQPGLDKPTGQPATTDPTTGLPF